MEAPSLLIADGSDDFRLALAEALQESYHVRCCGDGKQALALLRSWQPEILVLDLMLPSLDGLTLLQMAAQEQLRPKVLAMTALVNDYILDAAHRLGVSYLVRRPCDVGAISLRVADLNHRPLPRPVLPDSAERLAEFLLALGLLPKHRGFQYLLEAVPLMEEKPDQSITKELYPAVALLCHTEDRHVERSIRSALSYAWNHRDASVWKRYFPASQDRCPSNALFIVRLSQLLKNL